MSFRKMLFSCIIVSTLFACNAWSLNLQLLKSDGQKAYQQENWKEALKNLYAYVVVNEGNMTKEEIKTIRTAIDVCESRLVSLPDSGYRIIDSKGGYRMVTIKTGGTLITVDGVMIDLPYDETALLVEKGGNIRNVDASMEKYFLQLMTLKGALPKRDFDTRFDKLRTDVLPKTFTPAKQ